MAAEPTVTLHSQLIGLIGDEDSVVGFLLGGIGQKIVDPISNQSETNVFIVHKETSTEEIEDAFRHFLSRTDMGVILITRLVADRMRHMMEMRDGAYYPIVLEIPAPMDPFEFASDGEELAQCRKMNIKQ